MDFPFRAGLVPRIVCTGGLVFTILFLLRLLPSLRVAPAAFPSATAVGEDAGDEDGSAEDYVFGTSSGRTWLVALLWFAGFFVALAVLGAILAVPLFAAAYLLVEGRVHPVWAVTYAAGLWVLLFVGFDRVLELSLPTGLW
jgi:hypothetical protein